SLVHPAVPAPIPLLTGLRLTDVRVGRLAESEQVYRALELIERLGQSAAGAQLPPQRLDCSRPHQLVMVTRRGTIVQFDTRDFAPQLRRLNVILYWARQRQRQIRTVDLTVRRGVPVTWVN
ncbi:hypothetical protein HQ590_16560, partial [bacterium]|nr:hypothetical protein [bacterium]